MIGRHLLKRLRAALVFEHQRVTYAQCGEDIIMEMLFGLLGIARPTYLDIGAHHPSFLSNTYLLYKGGSRGVCVEPNPTLCANIRRKRPGDLCLNVGVGAGDGQTDLVFYVLDDPVLSTFSKEVADEQLAGGKQTIKERLQIPLRSVNAIIDEHLRPHPNLVSLDTEGFDLTILQSFDFARYRPEVFCIETLTNVGERKMTEIIDFMLGNGYMIYADTFINTIFVEKSRWAQRRDAAPAESL